MCFYCGRVDGGELKKISDSKTSSAVTASVEELLFISEQNDVNLAGKQSTWVVNSSASFHQTPNRVSFSSYIVGEYGYLKIGNDNVL